VNEARGKRYGLIGERLEHSYSKRIHSLLGDYTYELIPLRREEMDSFFRKADFDGLNVTLPYKQAVIPYCARLSETARVTGSVNTLVRRSDGKLLGDNTDVFGFMDLAERAGLQFTGKQVLVLGSGGTSRTVCAVIRAAGGEPVIISRSGDNRYGDLERHANASLLVNTTPVGMYPDMAASPVDLKRLPMLTGVLDVVYNPLRTRLCQQAEELGMACESGLSMLVTQAAKSYERFMGGCVSCERIEAVLADLRKEVTNLVLVGAPGCGKTILGERLACSLGLSLVDLERDMARERGCSVPELLAGEGEASGRRRETARIRQYARKGGYVLTAGYGAVCDRQNLEYLRFNGYIVHLERPPGRLFGENASPPQDRTAPETLWQQRKPLYAACADATVLHSGTVEDCVQKVTEVYREALHH